MKVEIIGGNGIKNAFKTLGVKADRTYHGDKFSVYEIDKHDLKTLEDATWNDGFGWFSYATGSNLGSAYEEFTINNVSVLGWAKDSRDKLFDTWHDMDFEQKSKYNHQFKMFEDEIMPRTYDSLLTYFCDELGVSTGNNITAVATHMAKNNGMKMSKLFSLCVPA